MLRLPGQKRALFQNYRMTVIRPEFENRTVKDDSKRNVFCPNTFREPALQARRGNAFSKAIATTGVYGGQSTMIAAAFCSLRSCPLLPPRSTPADIVSSLRLLMNS
jgi:hypothetical protein